MITYLPYMDTHQLQMLAHMARYLLSMIKPIMNGLREIQRTLYLTGK